MGQANWMRAYLEKASGSDAACPECGIGRISWRLVADPATRIGYALLWCDECHKGSHLSRVCFPAGLELASLLDPKSASDGVPNIEFVDD